MIKLKRVYEKPETTDGFRILVERLWPRGLTKEKARIDLWAKEVSPSPELRKWFSHDSEKWGEFCKRYKKELLGKQEQLGALREAIGKGTTTFVFAASDQTRNSAVLLKEFLENQENL